MSFVPQLTFPGDTQSSTPQLLVHNENPGHWSLIKNENNQEIAISITMLPGSIWGEFGKNYPAYNNISLPEVATTIPIIKKNHQQHYAIITLGKDTSFSEYGEQCGLVMTTYQPSEDGAARNISTASWLKCVLERLKDGHVRVVVGISTTFSPTNLAKFDLPSTTYTVVTNEDGTTRISLKFDISFFLHADYVQNTLNLYSNIPLSINDVSKHLSPIEHRIIGTFYPFSSISDFCTILRGNESTMDNIDVVPCIIGHGGKTNNAYFNFMEVGHIIP